MISKDPPHMLPSGNLPHGNIALRDMLVFGYLGLLYGRDDGGSSIKRSRPNAQAPPPPTQS
jgi:hypothetical protein